LRGSSFLIFLKTYSQRGKFVFAPILTSVSLKDGGRTKGSLVIALMMDTGLGENSNFLATAGEEPSPISDSCTFGTRGDFLVDGFFGGIVPVIKATLRTCIQNNIG
jgi:hypothetical protein